MLGERVSSWVGLVVRDKVVVARREREVAAGLG